MFKNILVPTDLTKKSEEAFEIAISMAKDGKAMVTLLHVIERIEGAEEEEFLGFYEKLKERAIKGIGAMKKRHKMEGIEVHEEVIIGKRVPEIIRFSNDNNTDLIILSSHKIENFSSGEGWATISYKVAILAACPVMIVK